MNFNHGTRYSISEMLQRKITLKDFMLSNKMTTPVVKKLLCMNSLPLPHELINYICEYLFFDNVQTNARICKMVIRRMHYFKREYRKETEIWSQCILESGFCIKKYQIFLVLNEKRIIQFAYCKICGGCMRNYNDDQYIRSPKIMCACLQ
jgi:hypothetical protein